ncbi:MAG: porin [Thiohalomonadaceae bacterium]
MFKRKHLVVAIAAAACTFSTLATAGAVNSKSEMDIYGRAHLSLDSLDNGAAYNEMNISSNASRIGFKGKTDFGDVTGFFQIEQQINFDTEGGEFATRNTFAGVRGDFGMVRFGKFDSPFKAARGPANLFGDQVGDIRNLTRVGNGRFDERFENVIHYQTPKFGAMQLNVAYSIHEGDAATSGDKEASVSTSLTYKQGALDLAAAYESRSEDSDRGERSAMRLAAGYKVMDSLRVVGFYQSVDHTNDAHDANVMGAGLNYTITPKKTYLKTHYLMRSADAANSDSNMIAVGVEHRIHSDLRFYANVAQVSNDDNVSLTPWGQARTATPAGANGETARGISIGMMYNF